jgi:hypothetical protein
VRSTDETAAQLAIQQHYSLVEGWKTGQFFEKA